MISASAKILLQLGHGTVAKPQNPKLTQRLVN